MVFHWLNGLQNQLAKTQSRSLGRGKRRRPHRSVAAVPVEACETRVLLSAVTATADPTDYASLPDDLYDSPDYFDTASESPLGEEISGVEDEYSEYEDSWYESLDESYGEATTSQEEYNDSSYEYDDDQSEGSNEQSGEATETPKVGGYQSLIGQLLGGLSGGAEEGESSDSADEDTNNQSDTESESNISASALEFPEYIEFAAVELPLQSQTDDLFQITPAGTDSFSNETVTTSVATQPVESDDSTLEPLSADLNQTIVQEQSWTSDTDWTVHQSVTDSFQQDSSDGNEDGSGIVPEITGTESYSITVINGTTTIETHSIASSTRLAEGNIPSDTVDDENGDNPYAIPQSWIEASSTPIALSSDSDDTESNSSESADDALDSESESGSFTSYNTGLTTTVTTTQIVLSDGTAAIQTSITMSWYAGFSWRTGGDIGNDLLGSGDETSGTTVDLSGDYKVFASASIGGHFTVTTVTAASNNEILPDEGSISAGFAVTAMAGGSLAFTTKFGRDASSGSIDNGTDTKDFVNLTDTQESSGRVGLSFWIAGSTADDEGSEPGSNDSESGSDTTAAPKVGELSAEEVLATNKSGIQLNLEIEGSTGSSKDHTVESKVRPSEYVTVTSSYTELSSTNSNTSFAFAAGTEDISVSVGAGGDSSKNLTASYENLSTADNGENTSEGIDDETLIVFDRLTETEVSSSEWSANFSLGTGDGYQNEQSLSYDVTFTTVEDFGDIFNGQSAGYEITTVYVDYSPEDDPEESNEERPEREHTRTTRFYSPESSSTDFADLGQPDGSGGLDTAPTYDDGTKTPDQILADYRAQKEQLLRLQALLADPSTSPERKELLQDLIAKQEESLEEIIVAAGSAGITASQLEEEDNAAEAALINDPPTSTELGDLGEDDIHSNAPGYFHFLFNPSDMDDDLESGTYKLWAVAGTSLAVAGGLAALPALAEWAGAELLVWQGSSGGLAFAGAGGAGAATTTIAVSNGTVATAAGLATITALFMEYGDALNTARETFETNPEFKRYFHKVYKPQQKLTGGGKRNPDLALSEILDALIEWIELGMPVVK